MLLLQEPQLSTNSPCAYIENTQWRFEYFFAADLNRQELNKYLCLGWRKFGIYFFRPNCPSCRKCIPLRVLVDRFTQSKSQRRVLKKCQDITVKLRPLSYNNTIFEIYKDHSLKRFNRKTNKEEFISTFYTQSCPSMQSEYYYNNQLIAVGFLDISDHAFSSVYFIYHTQYEKLSLGTFSVLKEIDLAADLCKQYYYLGYYIKENKSMRYKNDFVPHQLYNWHSDHWEKPVDK